MTPAPPHGWRWEAKLPAAPSEHGGRRVLESSGGVVRGPYRRSGLVGEVRRAGRRLSYLGGDLGGAARPSRCSCCCRRLLGLRSPSWEVSC